MKGLTNHERRYSIANDEIIEEYNASSVFLSSSFGRSNIGGSSEPTLNHVSAEPVNENTESQSIEELQTFRWKINDCDISEIPEIYPRLSYPLIVRDREVSEIGDRLGTFLRNHGIRSAYDRKQGRLLCCTEKVGFVVQIWRRRNPVARTAMNNNNNNNNNNNSPSKEEIILEIQRRKGCSWTMQKIRSALKRTIIQKQKLSQSPSSADLKKPQLSQKSKPSFFLPPFHRHNSTNAIGMIEPLILPYRFVPLQRDVHQTREDESSSSTTSEDSSSPTSTMSWKETGLRPRKTPDFPSPFSFPPPLQPNF